MGKIYLVGSEKGGVGKTSIAGNLAVMRAKCGHKVALVDADKRTSASLWAGLRLEAGHLPALLCVQKTGRLGPDLLQLREHYEVVVDTGGEDSVELRHSIAVADRWICPVRVGVLDLFTIAKMSRLLEDIAEKMEHRPHTNILLNAVPASTREYEEAREDLAEYENMPVMEAQLIERKPMRTSIRMSCAVVELPQNASTAPCVQELTQVYEEVFGEPYAPAAQNA